MLDGMLARWYLLLGQYSVTFEYRPGAQHANVDGMSRQCGQCQKPDCPVSSSDWQVAELDTSLVLLNHPFASSEMGDSMDADLLPELSGETWVAATLLEGLTADLLPAGSDIDLIVASRQDAILTTVREWVHSGVIPTWSDCAGQYIVCRIEFIGRDCVTTFVLTWHHVLFVWHASLRVHGGLPCDMCMWGTDSIG